MAGVDETAGSQRIQGENELMKNIMNFIILFMVLFLGNKIAPEAIVSESWKTTLLAAVICMVAEVIMGLCIAIFAAVAAAGIRRLGMILALLAFIIISGYMLPISALWVCGWIIDGFQIHGIATYAILALTINVLSISGKKKNQEDYKTK